jgi:hypothetical protein
VALLIFLAATCSSNDETNACPTPAPGSAEDALLQSARKQASFTLLFPCYLPLSQKLTDSSVTGDPGRQEADLVWGGPFEMTVRQSQFAPAVSPDPTGASRVVVDLFPNVSATLIEQNDGTGKALYHLFWERGEIYYELQAFGPPLQRQTILQIARSLQ